MSLSFQRYEYGIFMHLYLYKYLASVFEYLILWPWELEEFFYIVVKNAFCGGHVCLFPTSFLMFEPLAILIFIWFALGALYKKYLNMCQCHDSHVTLFWVFSELMHGHSTSWLYWVRFGTVRFPHNTTEFHENEWSESYIYSRMEMKLCLFPKFLVPFG
jgi:hypothetical protein